MENRNFTSDVSSRSKASLTFLYGNDFDVGGDELWAAKVELFSVHHLISLLDCRSMDEL